MVVEFDPCTYDVSEPIDARLRRRQMGLTAPLRQHGLPKRLAVRRFLNVDSGRTHLARRCAEGQDLSLAWRASTDREVSGQ